MLRPRPIPGPLRTASVALASCLLVIIGPSQAAAQGPSGLQQLRPGAEEEAAGTSVDVDGDFIVTGVPGDDADGEGAGAARVYSHLGGNWIHEQRLAPTDAAPGDGFGTAVAIASDRVVVGAPGNDAQGTDSGAVYVFRRVDGVWTQEQKLVASDAAAGAALGSAVTIDGDRVLAGAPGDTGAGSAAGAAYVFQLLDGVWTEEQTLAADHPSPDARFGAAVDLVGNHALVGAPGDGAQGDDAGAAYAFQWVAGSWFQEQRLTPDDPAAGDAFGSDVALTATGNGLVGAPGADRLDAEDSGAVYAFERLQGVWLQQQDIFPAAPRAGDAIGSALGVDGKILAIGAPGDADWGEDSGSAYVLTLEDDGFWLQRSKVAASDADAGDRLGSGVAVSAPSVVAGAPADVVDGLVGAGSVWVFAFVGPEAPRRLRARRTDGPTALQLRWRDRSETETGFEIFRAEARGGALERVATLGPDTTAFVDEDLDPRTRYCYEVAAVNAFGGSRSNLNCARTRKARPRPPRRLRAEASAETVELSWRDRSDNEEGFVILRKVPGEGPFTDVAEVDADVTSFTDEDVEAGTRYCYRVKAHNELGGRSASSNRDCVSVSGT